MAEEDDDISVSNSFDAWARCMSSRYQRDRLYRYGNFEPCSAQWKDIGIVMKAKWARTKEEKEDLLNQTFYRKNLGGDQSKSPTAGVIWELKEKPSWEYGK
mmetsp:Transcript_13221/g.15144  ORF Transcript_13221/g.15144 Transcript_13221/m.15144 type:complete len:101 (+) Transcript_13221:93-395(+)|eukprot:CAMPEP_0194133406 /NCGR_PEP_ID=MMETSP0152-20130528/3598_1 /TAXON_ID=1049557 /ORGANISM="Thalassiothrix antarctica, Strain L6-D1" /LENGTH=100 /DNA_ID=CAMNT_0038828723 /DNA_START=82 /DNA_END=384 /DNA_ORIENTATION=+